MAITIHFDRSLYLPEAVQAAAAAYAEHASIEVATQAESVTATVSAAEDVELIADAFANHALHETIIRLRQGAEAL